MEKEKLIKELNEKFKNLKKELNFTSSFEEVDSIAFMEDMILSAEYVSSRFSRQLINRMVDYFNSWIGTMHQWLMPNPQDMIFMSEANKLTKEEKEEITMMVSKIMYFVRKNKRIAFEEEKTEEGTIIDELVKFSKEEFDSFMLKYHKKMESAWKKAIK
jgi:hypothetical protein